MAISNQTVPSPAVQPKTWQKAIQTLDEQCHDRNTSLAQTSSQAPCVRPGQFTLGVAGPLHGTPVESLTDTSTKPLSSQLVPSSPNVEPTGVLDDLTLEDQAIWSGDCSRWDNPEYWLMIEEMMVFVDMLNSLSTACGLCTWFCISPGMSTSFAQALSGGTIIHNYLHPAGIPPIPLETPYVSIPTHLQDNSSNCGFWVVVIALTLLLGLDTRDIYALRPADIKHMLATLYTSYVCGNGELDIEEVAKVLGRHKLSSMALCHMDSNGPSHEPFKISGIIPPVDMTRSSSDETELLFLTLCNYKQLEFTVNGIYPLNAAKLQTLRSQGELSETVINSYVHLYTLDIHASTTNLPSFDIFDTILADRIRDAPLTATFGPPGQGRGRRKKGSKLTSWIPEVRETYVPRMDAWALWPLAPGDLHFPERITACDISSQVATFRVFYDILPLPNTYEFTRTFTECYDLMGAPDDSVPELQTYQIPKLRWPADLDMCDLEAAEAQGLADDQIRDILSPAKAAARDYLCTVIDTVAEILVQPSRTSFNRLVDQWNECLAKCTRSTLDAGLTFDFFREHSQYLDNVDAYIIGSSCASRLACVLRETHGIQGHLEQTNLVFGPGCTILAYHLLGNQMGLGAEETYVLEDQGHLYRPSSDHELVWEAMRGRISLSVKGHDDFEQTHRIMDTTIKLPGVEVSFASDPKAHIEETPSHNVDKRDVDAGHSKELVPQEAVTVIPKASQLESPDVLQGHEGEAMASEIKVQHSLPQPQFHLPRGDQQPFVPLPYSAGSQAHPSSDAMSLSVVQQSSPRVYIALDSADVSNAQESKTIDAAPEVGSALATDQLPLIRLVKTAEGWKASAGALPHGKLQAHDTSGDGLARNHMGTQKTSNPKRKRSPEGVLALADVGDPSTPETNHQQEGESAREEEHGHMTLPTDCRGRALAATAVRAQDQPSPPPQPFAIPNPPPRSNVTDPFQQPVAGPSHPPMLAPSSRLSMLALSSHPPMLAGPSHPPNLSPGEQVAALCAQLAVIPPLQPLRRNRPDPAQPAPVVGSAAIADLCAQAAALRPLGRHRPASVQPAPPPVVGSAAVAALWAQAAPNLRPAPNPQPLPAPPQPLPAPPQLLPAP
ncbi:hypothetical protein JB92DRAFT_3122741 [Gautieria morchelliformis]|nr:hypothetical protein JB92DRAFT_3122741 [Gautieria morchelliformis]